MKEYRIFLLDGNRFVRAEVVRASDDCAAAAEARRRTHSLQAELWQGRRRVGKILPGSELLHAMN
jgi:hypothetical protein